MQVLAPESQAIVKLYCAGLNHPREIALCLSTFGSWENAWKAPYSAFTTNILTVEKATQFIKNRPKIALEKIVAELTRHGIQICTIADTCYPRTVREIADPPPVLFVRGSMEILSTDPIIGIVGTRKPTWYGKQITQQIADDLADQRVIAASGLAYGVDAIVHDRYSEKHVPTIAVLAGGIDRATLYPQAHAKLAERIVADGGAIISEHYVGTPALAHQFPQRNRIISGLARGTLIIEGKYQSGAMITARYALEQNREVMAVPGNITSPLSDGPNDLIAHGAHVIRNAKEVCEILGITYKKITEKSVEAISPAAKKILQFVSPEPIHIDKLIQVSTLEASTCAQALTELELAGMIKNVGGSNYVKLT